MVDANIFQKSVTLVGCIAAQSCNEPQNTLGLTPVLNPTKRPCSDSTAVHPMCIAFNYLLARFICASDLVYNG